MSDRSVEHVQGWAFDNIQPANDELRDQVADGEQFISTVAIPAFDEVRQQLSRDGNEVSITNHHSNALLRVVRDGREIFSYSVRMQMQDRGAFPFFQARGVHGRWNAANEGHLRPDTPENQGYNATHITKDELVQHVLHAFQVETEP